MNKEVTVSSRPDRDITKRVIVAGDYDIVPYEDSRCKISLSDVEWTNKSGECEIQAESRILSNSFDGNVLIGDSDSFIDRDLDLVIQQMCSGETCEANLIYRDNELKVVKHVTCKIKLHDVMEEQLISDWGWERLSETANHHKERGVLLVKEKRITDAFKRFNKALTMLIAIEPIDPNVIDDDRLKELVDLKVKIYNNLAYCQLYYNEYDAVIQLCNQALKYQSDNAKSLYRRCCAYNGIKMYEEAWADIQRVMLLDPYDKAAHQKANEIKPKIKEINKNYTNLIKKMFN